MLTFAAGTAPRGRRVLRSRLSLRCHELRRLTALCVHGLVLALLPLDERIILNSVLAGEVLEVFDVLLVHLLEYLLQVLGLGALHVRVELLLLLLSEQVDLVGGRRTAVLLGGLAE